MVGENLTLVDIQAPVDELMPIVEERMRIIFGSKQPEFETALDNLITSGGKRVRPKINLLVGLMLGSPTENLITSAAAIELLHTATLVHDDLIDGALFRRGEPTLNSNWNSSKTVLAGDLLFSYAAKLAAMTESIEIVHLFADTLGTIVQGEVTQLFEKRLLENRDEYYERIYSKTASLFEAAAVAAGILSPATQESLDAVRTYGREVGMAFQIVDDILDFTGVQSIIGKPVANDLRQGLITLPTIYYIENNPDDSSVTLALNGGNGNQAMMDRLINEIRESGAIEQAREEALRFSNRGLQALENLPDNDARQALENLVIELVDRQV